MASESKVYTKRKESKAECSRKREYRNKEEEDTGDLGNSGTNPRGQISQGCPKGQRQRDFGHEPAYPSTPTDFRSSTPGTAGEECRTTDPQPERKPQLHPQEAPASPQPSHLHALCQLFLQNPGGPDSWLLCISEAGNRKVSVTAVSGPAGGGIGQQVVLELPDQLACSG